jgi:hypothetical protein
MMDLFSNSHTRSKCFRRKHHVRVSTYVRYYQLPLHSHISHMLLWYCDIGKKEHRVRAIPGRTIILVVKSKNEYGENTRLKFPKSHALFCGGNVTFKN